VVGPAPAAWTSVGDSPKPASRLTCRPCSTSIASDA
jgi:hypothetical protein